MLDKIFGYELASNADLKKNNFIVEKFELSEEKDHIDLSYILASSVPNGNGALLTKEELESAKDSIINQPLIIVPEWDNLPTGHSVEEFPKLSWGALVIGTHTGAEIAEEDGITHLKAKAQVWKIRYPEISQVLVSLHEAGNLKFSMESRFKSQTVEGATRTLHGVKFIGAAVVNDPANPFSYALEVANKKHKEDKVVNFEQAMELLKTLNVDVYALVNTELSNRSKTISDLEEEKTGLETSSKTVSQSLKDANKTIDDLETELSAIKEAQLQAELSAKQEKRFEEISEYVDFLEDEIASKKEAYGKMDEDTFNLVLETAKRNKKAESSSNVAFASDTGLDLKKTNNFLDGLGE